MGITEILWWFAFKRHGLEISKIQTSLHFKIGNLTTNFIEISTFHNYSLYIQIGCTGEKKVVILINSSFHGLSTLI